MNKRTTFLFAFFIVLFKMAPVAAINVPITVFPLAKYNQDVNYWINPEDADYNQPLIDSASQKKLLKDYYNHYCASGPNALSPWGNKFVNKMLEERLNTDVSLTEEELFKKYSNIAVKELADIGYGENFRPYTDKWIKQIILNLNPQQFKKPFKYLAKNRGIVIKNTMARRLPTIEPNFGNFTQAGEGYPFDNMQDSAIWAGTPVYIIAKTQDGKWSLIITSSFISWVESDGIATASSDFVTVWQKYAKQKIAAITKTNLGISDTHKQYRFNTYIGTVFPTKKINKRTLTVLIPYANRDHQAHITFADISKQNAKIIPLLATPHNFANIISELIGRPYGWGNMYFYNDCSAELQSVYTPFGIWLPRNSSKQIASREIIDKSSLTTQEQLQFLKENGRKFTTLIYTKGHVMMYIGSYPNPNSPTHEPMVMTYQNVWGLSPQDRKYRAIIGKAVLFPLLEKYPENKKLRFTTKKCFQLIHLDKV
jgi:cell wall-associated NlpC family hydrolase